MATNVHDKQTSAAASGNSNVVQWQGGRGTWSAVGTFGGGTSKLQWSPDNSTWIDVTSASKTSSGYTNFEIGAGFLRTNLAGATGASIVNTITGYL